MLGARPRQSHGTCVQLDPDYYTQKTDEMERIQNARIAAVAVEHLDYNLNLFLENVILHPGVLISRVQVFNHGFSLRRKERVSFVREKRMVIVFSVGMTAIYIGFKNQCPLRE